ncbi:MAG: MFS transporter, partial [Gammaproteobacteria bacterium]|nr:MFS transporter [Gammaproteobacteria bacterium]
ALMPPMQGALIDGASLIGEIPSVQTSFVLPLICFVVIAIYGYRAHFVHKV